MTYDEYVKFDHETPYTYVIRAKADASSASAAPVLYYFGEKHVYDPAHEQFAKVREFWNAFLVETASLGGQAKKRIAFIEGGMGAEFSDETEAILKEGGMGFITYLARKEGIEVYSPEPSPAYERGELEKEFSREEIQYYYFARQVHQWCRLKEPRPDFESYINQYVEMDRVRSGWADFDFSIDGMKKIHTNMFGTSFDENDFDFFTKTVNPIDEGSVINNVSKCSGMIRDEFIVKEIQRYMADGYSIYVQFGSSHAVMQEGVLREIFAVK